MRGHRFDRILASSALALVLGLSTPALSQSVSPEEAARVEGRIPVPDTTLPPPPTAADVTKPVSASASASVAPSPAPSVAEPAPAAAAAASPAEAPYAPATAQPAPAETQPAPVAAQPAPSEPQPAPVAAQPAPEVAQPATTAEPAAQPAVTVADQDLSDKLRDLITGRNADRYFARRNERSAAEAFYKQRNYEPLFVEARKQSPRGAAVVSYLRNVDADGLEP